MSDAAARWLESRHSHDLMSPLLAAWELSGLPGLNATLTQNAMQIVTEFGVSQEVAIRRAQGDRKYVTVNEIGSALCMALTGEDPGMGKLMGAAWSARVRALRMQVQKGMLT